MARVKKLPSPRTIQKDDKLILCSFFNPGMGFDIQTIYFEVPKINQVQCVAWNYKYMGIGRILWIGCSARYRVHKDRIQLTWTYPVTLTELSIDEAFTICPSLRRFEYSTHPVLDGMIRRHTPIPHNSLFGENRLEYANVEQLNPNSEKFTGH